MRLPSKGEFLDLDDNVDASKTKGLPGSIRMKSAGASGVSRPPGNPRISAGVTVIDLSNVGKSISSLCTSSRVAGNSVSRPTVPKVASEKGRR